MAERHTTKGIEFFLTSYIIMSCIIFTEYFIFNSLPNSYNFRHLLITFADSVEPDQAGQKFSSDLNPNP